MIMDCQSTTGFLKRQHSRSCLLVLSNWPGLIYLTKRCIHTTLLIQILMNYVQSHNAFPLIIVAMYFMTIHLWTHNHLVYLYGQKCQQAFCHNVCFPYSVFRKIKDELWWGASSSFSLLKIFCWLAVLKCYWLWIIPHDIHPPCYLPPQQPPSCVTFYGTGLHLCNLGGFIATFKKNSGCNIKETF